MKEMNIFLRCAQDVLQMISRMIFFQKTVMKYFAQVARYNSATQRNLSGTQEENFNNFSPAANLRRLSYSYFPFSCLFFCEEMAFFGLPHSAFDLHFGSRHILNGLFPSR